MQPRERLGNPQKFWCKEHSSVEESLNCPSPWLCSILKIVALSHAGVDPMSCRWRLLAVLIVSTTQQQVFSWRSSSLLLCLTLTNLIRWGPRVQDLVLSWERRVSQTSYLWLVIHILLVKTNRKAQLPKHGWSRTIPSRKNYPESDRNRGKDVIWQELWRAVRKWSGILRWPFCSFHFKFLDLGHIGVL